MYEIIYESNNKQKNNKKIYNPGEQNPPPARKHTFLS